MREQIIRLGIKHPKATLIIMILTTLICGAMIPLIKVDTDPENMLSEDEAVRVFHNDTKKRFNLHDIVVVGVVNEKDPDGVFNPDSLKRIHELTEFAAGLQWPDKDDPAKQIGVIEHDIIAPSTVENIEQGGPNQITLRWLMPQPPATRAEAQVIRARALNSPLLADTLVSEDGKALCIYLPLSSKDLSHNVYVALKDKIATFTGPEKYYITGLPVAEDTFGVEMFIQMAISAPLAMAVIFLLMLAFFRKLVLVISPMIIAMVSVITAMGLLIGSGHPVHIMSSMIPIFLMPIAVVDSVHILSEFFDRYAPQLGREKSISQVMDHLFMPMLYTSLTSAAGFASLALTPIPPVQVFGVFVALGIMVAWLWTVLFVPAYVMLLSEKQLANFGAGGRHEAHTGLLPRILARLGQATYNYAKPILAVFVIIAAVAVYGVTRIQINDNPVKWFAKSHPIRQADIELNQHFGGTYMAYLVIDAQTTDTLDKSFEASLNQELSRLRTKLQNDNLTGLDAAFTQAQALLAEAIETQYQQDNPSKDNALTQWIDAIKKELDKAPDDAFDAWYELEGLVRLELQKDKQPMKNPAMLRYLCDLQAHVKNLGVVGKSSAVTDVVKTVRREMYDGKQEQATIPDNFTTVGEFLTQAQSGHRPDDLWHLVTPDYRGANLWLQLTSGDNKDMEAVVTTVNRYIADNPPPLAIEHHWAGLTYINTVWQDKMVWGMIQSFLGSFLVVFIMMAVLFRSPLWGLVCMVPLTLTIVLIYGVIGLVGKDYDMPVAVLSSLTLGMAVDFAIHFLQRARQSYAEHGSWQAGVKDMFGEPARAIARNVIVIAIGFLPLLAAPLVPYKTVGIFLCSIMAVSGLVTLMILPALLRIGEKHLFKASMRKPGPACNCGFCVVLSIASVLLVALNIHQYAMIGWSALAWISAAAIPVLALTCSLMSRRQACKAQESKTTN